MKDKFLAILCDLFGMAKWPLQMVKWPPNRGWKGHELNHLVCYFSFQGSFKGDCHWQKNKVRVEAPWFTKKTEHPKWNQKGYFWSPWNSTSTMKSYRNHLDKYFLFFFLQLWSMINPQTSWNMEYHLASCINIGNLNVPEVFGHVFFKEYLQVQSWKIPPGFIQICKKQLIKYGPWTPRIMAIQLLKYRWFSMSSLPSTLPDPTKHDPPKRWNVKPWHLSVQSQCYCLRKNWSNVEVCANEVMNEVTNKNGCIYTGLRASILALNMFSLKQWRNKNTMVIFNVWLMDTSPFKWFMCG